MALAAEDKSKDLEAEVLALKQPRGLQVEAPPLGPDGDFRRRVASAFALMDRHGNGFLTRVDVIQTLRADGNEYLHDMLQLPHHIRQEDGTRDQFNHLFRAIDKDESDNISLEEWERWCFLAKDSKPAAEPPAALRARRPAQALEPAAEARAPAPAAEARAPSPRKPWTDAPSEPAVVTVAPPPKRATAAEVKETRDQRSLKLVWGKDAPVPSEASVREACEAADEAAPTLSTLLLREKTGVLIFSSRAAALAGAEKARTSTSWRVKYLGERAQTRTRTTPRPRPPPRRPPPPSPPFR